MARARALFLRFINAMIALLAAIGTANEAAVFWPAVLTPPSLLGLEHDLMRAPDSNLRLRDIEGFIIIILEVDREIACSARSILKIKSLNVELAQKNSFLGILHSGSSTSSLAPRKLKTVKFIQL